MFHIWTISCQCPVRRDKVEQANIFVGMTNVIDEDKFMEE